MDDLKVAAVCMNAAAGKVEENLDRIQSFVLEAAGEDADIICFPELSVTGYILKNPLDAYKGPDPNKVIDRLVGMAREAGLILVAGLIEPSGEAKPYITQVIAGPGGLIGFYRKSHLSPSEKDIYQAGQVIQVFSYQNTTFGVQLCYEAHFPEISTIMALMGADIFFVPHASPRGTPEKKLQSWLRHLKARAFDNGVFVVACNQAGKTGEGFLFPGVALVLGPDGEVLAQYIGNEENILFADLAAEALINTREHRMKYFLPQRRPELYKDIL
ncbi:MAG: hypothetical protein GY864_08995 [Desulfobacterales bacterium]|nr:hypothetical protein [Desulfobacterales bacterium]